MSLASANNVLKHLISIQLQPVRTKILVRGKSPGIAKTLKQRLEELNYKDPELHYKVNIGFSQPKSFRTKVISNGEDQVDRRELERLSRIRKLEIPLDKVKDVWMKTVGPQQIKKVAEHYGIFEDLFGDADFLPLVNLNIYYNHGELCQPVYRGNIIKPKEAQNSPIVTYDADPNSLWTLQLINPDGHFTSENTEYIHWFIGNIPGADFKKGEAVVEYLQPFPPRGTGYQRFIFILYKQEKKIDFSKYKKSGKCLQLADRSFRTLDFYTEHQDDITPAGLAFFQSDWDLSLTDFFHNTLNMQEPIFEYDFPQPYIRPQEWFPRRKPFNLYMDKYKDPKDVNKRYLQMKMKSVHPFKKPDPPFPLPNAMPLRKSIPSWLKLEIKRNRLGWGRINEV